VPEDMFKTPPVLIPKTFSLYNFAKVIGLTRFGDIGFLSDFKNSLIISLLTTILATSSGGLAAYSLCHIRGRGGKILSRLILLTYMFPAIFFIIPLFKILNSVKLTDTKIGITLSFLAWAFPYSTWLLIAYFGTLPRELEEAAYIDGAGHMSTFLRIVMPLAKPGAVAAAVFCFISAWTDFMFGFVLSSTTRSKTLAVGLFEQLGGEIMLWPDILTWSFLMVVPVVIFFLIFQKQFISGLTAGAVKG
jgi:multiple sugar transport system permease protein